MSISADRLAQPAMTQVVNPAVYAMKAIGPPHGPPEAARVKGRLVGQQVCTMPSCSTTDRRPARLWQADGFR